MAAKPCPLSAGPRIGVEERPSARRVRPPMVPCCDSTQPIPAKVFHARWQAGCSWRIRSSTLPYAVIAAAGIPAAAPVLAAQAGFTAYGVRVADRLVPLLRVTGAAPGLAAFGAAS